MAKKKKPGRKLSSRPLGNRPTLTPATAASAQAADTPPAVQKKVAVLPDAPPLPAPDDTLPATAALDTADETEERAEVLETTEDIATSDAPAAAAPSATTEQAPAGEEPSEAAALSQTRSAPVADTPAETLLEPAALLGAQFKPSPRPMRRRWGKRLLIAGIPLLILAAALHWLVLPHLGGDVATPNQALLKEISARAVLPVGETPVVTTVVDKSKATQPFLAGANNGDKVLLYFQAGRAVVYRPSTHQIVNMGSLEQPPARVFLRDGRADSIPPDITALLNAQSGFTVVSRDVSANQYYAHTLVIDLTGDRPDMAARLAQLVHGRVAHLPSGENRPDADLLVIVGADAQ